MNLSGRLEMMVNNVISQKVKPALWAIVDAMACNTAQFVKNPGTDFTRGLSVGYFGMG